MFFGDEKAVQEFTSLGPKISAFVFNVQRLKIKKCLLISTVLISLKS
jgi:hypothetical protein